MFGRHFDLENPCPNINSPKSTQQRTEEIVLPSVVRLLDFHNRSSKIIGQDVSIDDRL